MPEHDFDAQAEDGNYIDHRMDEDTGVPIISLYSDKLAPNEENTYT